ncbi:MAG: 4-hydroxy-tetrahydrodipicolinate reductase [Acidimicrobiales bacterium]
MRVAVVGAGGKVGREVCRAVLARDDLALVAAVDTGFDGQDLEALVGVPAGHLVVSGDLDSLTLSGTEVVVDFTRLDAARTTLEFCAHRGIHAVVGTTGFGVEDLDRLATRFAGPDVGSPNCVVAPNFAIGAVLMMRFAELAAPWFDGAEVIELHHAGKLDAPSGTAVRTAERMATARSSAGSGSFPPDRTTTTVLSGARGADGPTGIRIHSVRLPGLVAHQEVILGAVGQSLTLRHDSYDRSSFMAGVLLAVHQVPSRPGLTLGIEPLLGL